MAKRKKDRPLTKKQIARKARIERDKMWGNLSKELRHEFPYCEVCFATENLQVHHLLERKYYPELLCNKSNLIVVCPKCHSFGRYSFHTNAVWASEWLRQNKPQQWQWVVNHMIKEQA